ncbi:EMC3/TMCO1 family protein [Candidatus Pacearchaeota archaeon]|nr:EMC3/TMCO1 family protein [Candidatus Pacearchaeota archaeon]
MDNNAKGSFIPIILVMAFSLIIASYWDTIPFIKEGVHKVLDPSAGFLLNWNLTIGMLIIVFAITLITTLIQKYTTDQKALRELRQEQKLLQEEMKKYKDHPEKLNELSKKQFEFIPKTFKLTSRGILFTGIPFILFFRWFYDTFATMGDPKFFGVLSWLWFYLISTVIFSSILRKVLKVV